MLESDIIIGKYNGLIRDRTCIGFIPLFLYQFERMQLYVERKDACCGTYSV